MVRTQKYEKESEMPNFYSDFFIFIMAVGRVSLWQLAEFRCGSWRKNSPAHPFEGMKPDRLITYCRLKNMFTS
jgi:hypothetical protein